MIRSERIDKMEEYIVKNGFVSLDNLSKEFGISLNTIRRDVSELLSNGKLKKVYGGVSAIKEQSPQSTLTTVSERRMRNLEQKERIAKYASTFVEDNSTIFVDSGSTTALMIPYLALKKNITIITHSLTIMAEAAKYDSLNLIGIGGIYQQSSTSFIGKTVIDAMQDMSFDMVFMGTTSIMEEGLATNIYLEAEIKKNIAVHAKKVFLLADHSKWEKRAAFSFCSYDSIDYLITDENLPENISNKMKDKNVSIIVV